MTDRQNAIVGCLLGTAVGDALGLPFEGLKAPRARKLLGPPNRHRLFLGRGLVSDDTEHTCLVAQALIESGGDPQQCSSLLAARLRWWLLSGPGGIGLATLRSCMKLWLGVSPERSGVYSAGNGPAMRAAIFGATVDDLPQLQKLVRSASRITHTDPKAEQGAFAVALAARMSAKCDAVTPDDYVRELATRLNRPDAAEFLSLIERLPASLARGNSTPEFAASLGLVDSVSGYVLHTVPVALHAWMRFPTDYRAAVTSVIECGGDTDSTAAIVGGIVGAAVGKAGIPEEWLTGLVEWPRSVTWMEHLGEQLSRVASTGTPERAIRASATGQLLRNAFFLLVILGHVFRRWLPRWTVTKRVDERSTAEPIGSS